MSLSDPMPGRRGETGAEDAPGPSGRGVLDRGEFAALTTRHRRSLWALAAGVLGRPDEVDDVLQEAAMIGLSKLEQFDPDTSFPAWMGQIVKHVALNRGRLRQRRRTEPTDPVVLDESHVHDDCFAVDVDDLEAGLPAAVDDELLHALQRLQPTPRACLLLRALADLDYASIGAMLDVVPQTAMRHVHRARIELQRVLTPFDPERCRA